MHCIAFSNLVKLHIHLNKVKDLNKFSSKWEQMNYTLELGAHEKVRFVL